MTTAKNRITTFVSDELKELVEQYMIENKLWSHSSAVSAILKDYFNLSSRKLDK